MQTAVMSSSLRLNVADLEIRRGRRPLIEPFTWEYRTGGIAWVFGTNGSGKSTLLRVFAGLAKPTGGGAYWSDNPGGKLLYHAPHQHVPDDVRVSDFVTFISGVGAGIVPHDLIDPLFPSNLEQGRAFKTLSTGETKRLMLWGMLRQGEGPLMLDEPYEHLSRDVKPVLTEILRWIADRAPVIVATNQDIEIRSQDSVLTLDGSIVEVRNALD